MFIINHSSLTEEDIASLYIKESSKDFLIRKEKSYSYFKVENGTIFLDRHYREESFKDVPEKHLRYLYSEGVASNKLKKISYEEYKRKILIEVGERPREHNYWRNVVPGYGIDYWYQHHGVGYRQKQKYQKKSHHFKKELTESDQSRKDWRDSKGFLRSRNKMKNWRVGLKSREMAEKVSSRSFRRMEKEQIRQENWDELADSNALSRLIRNPWDWD
jgi:hypothetical protein